MRVSVRFGLVALALVAGLVAAPAPARADAASAEAEIPTSREPFFLVTTTSTTASAFDDLSRRPEYAVYADGMFLAQKSDGRLWGTTLPHADVVEFMRFVLEDAQFPTVDMTYLIASPLTTFTQFTLKTRSGSYAARRRTKSLVGLGTKGGERTLAAVEAQLVALADRAQTVYTPGALLVVARRTNPNDKTPTWEANDRVPFAQLVDAADVERKTGTVVLGAAAEDVRGALAKGPEWRFGALGAELRLRPALPHELPAAPGPTPTAPTPPPVPPTLGEELPRPPPMVPDPTPPPTAPPTPPIAPTAPDVTAPSPVAGGAASADWKDDDLDFAGVQKIFVDLKKKAPGSPHGLFWNKGYDEFVAYEFALTSGDGRVRLIEPGDGQGSNLVKALRGLALTIRKADGTTRTEAFPVMPPSGKGVSDADLARIVRWIDHGAPKDRPAAGGSPTVTSQTPAPSAPVAPSPVPAPALDPIPAPAPMEWRDDDVDFAGVLKLLADLNRKTSGAPHGKFWTKSYEEFFAFEFDSSEGKVRLFEPLKGAESNLVRALQGKPLVVRAADGKTKEADFARMPPKGAPMPDADIERIRRWIDHGAPKERPAGGTAAAPASPRTPSNATPTGETRALTVVGSDTTKLGTEGPSEAGDAAPTVHVARSEADWTAIFATKLPAAGANGARVAKALTPLLLDSVRGYDFAASPLLLFVGPVTDNYTAELPGTVEILSDGSARVRVAHRHELRTYVVAPELGVWWAVVRVGGTCPERVIVSDPSK